MKLSPFGAVQIIRRSKHTKNLFEQVCGALNAILHSFYTAFLLVRQWSFHSAQGSIVFPERRKLIRQKAHVLRARLLRAETEHQFDLKCV